jgi:hypothetical protein
MTRVGSQHRSKKNEDAEDMRHTAGIYLERLRRIMKSVSIISDPLRFEPSTSCMQVTTVTDYDKFLNSEVIMRKAVLLRN